MRPGRSGVPPPVEHRFKSGREWRGNAGGRPKILFEASVNFLSKKGKDGKTNVERQIEHLHKIVMSNAPNNVAAFNALRNAACPRERAGDTTTNIPIYDDNIVRMVQGLLAERNEKIAKARETKS